MTFFGFVGSYLVTLWTNSAEVAALSIAIIKEACKPVSWTRAVRDVLGKQILFTGIHALGLIAVVAILAGLSVVAQVHAWLTQIGQSVLIGSVIVAVLFREAGPLLVNVIVIGRSGTAMATEIAAMNMNNEIHVLEAQGIDPLTYLIMPRAIGSALSVFSLTVFFNILSILSGLLFVISREGASRNAFVLVSRVLENIAPTDIVSLLLKTLLGGFLTGIICCRAGVAGAGKITDIPRAGTKGVVESLVALVVISALISLATYG